MPARDVVVRLELAEDEVVADGAGLAGRVELLGVEDLDRGSRRCPDLDLGPAREVLSDVVDDDARRRLRPAARRPHAHDADRLVGLGTRHSGGRIHGARRGPGRVVEARLAPSGELAPRVVGLAEVVAVVAGGAGGADLPGGVGANDVLRSVGVAEVEVETQPRRRAPLGQLPAPVPRARRAVVLPGAELRRDHVLPLRQERRDVVRRVEHALAVVGEAGVENAVRRGCAVQRELVVGEAGRVDAGPSDRLRDPEGLPQHRRRPQLAALALVVLDTRGREARREPCGRPAQLARRADHRVVGQPFRFGGRAAAFRPGDPFALPVARRQERRLEPRRRRPIARSS